MKGLIVYKTYYGSTRQYAQWLAEETGFELCTARENPLRTVKQSRIVVVGCPVMIGKLSLAKWIRKNWRLLSTKILVVFSTSGVKPSAELSEEVLSSSFPQHIRDSITYFPLHGRASLDGLKPVHRFLVEMGMRFMSNPEERKTFTPVVDGVDRDNLQPLLQHLRSIC